jgi:hypothetical protein
VANPGGEKLAWEASWIHAGKFAKQIELAFLYDVNWIRDGEVITDVFILDLIFRNMVHVDSKSHWAKQCRARARRGRAQTPMHADSLLSKHSVRGLLAFDCDHQPSAACAHCLSRSFNLEMNLFSRTFVIVLTMMPSSISSQPFFELDNPRMELIESRRKSAPPDNRNCRVL